MTTDSPPAVRPTPVLPPNAPRLRVSAEDGGQASAETSEPVILIGSRRDCHIPLQQNEVSAVHCALVNNGRNVLVVDLCSRSGVSLNNERVSIARIQPGDVLTIGGVRLRVSGDAPGGAGPSDAARDPRPLSHDLHLSLGGQVRPLATLPAVLGRRKACHVMIDTPDVSLAHALLIEIDGCPVVCDVGSRSGTHLNGERISLGWLAQDDVLDIGGEKLTIGWNGPFGPDRRAEQPAAEAVSADAGALETADAIASFAMEEGPSADGPGGCEVAELRALFAQAQRRFAALQQRAAAEAVRLNELDAAVRERQAQMDELAASLDERAAALEVRIAEFEARSQELRNRETLLATAEQQIAERERAIAAREAAEREAAGRLAEFRQALDQVSHALLDMNVPKGPVTVTKDGTLPGPVVHKPLFGAAQAGGV